MPSEFAKDISSHPAAFRSVGENLTDDGDEHSPKDDTTQTCNSWE